MSEPRTLRDAVYIDGVRLPIGRARADGYYAATRADDMAVRTIRALLERVPAARPCADRRQRLGRHDAGR